MLIYQLTKVPYYIVAQCECCLFKLNKAVLHSVRTAVDCSVYSYVSTSVSRRNPVAKRNSGFTGSC